MLVDFYYYIAPIIKANVSGRFIYWFLYGESYLFFKTGSVIYFLLLDTALFAGFFFKWNFVNSDLSLFRLLLAADSLSNVKSLENFSTASNSTIKVGMPKSCTKLVTTFLRTNLLYSIFYRTTLSFWIFGSLIEVVISLILLLGFFMLCISSKIVIDYRHFYMTSVIYLTSRIRHSMTAEASASCKYIYTASILPRLVS